MRAHYCRCVCVRACSNRVRSVESGECELFRLVATKSEATGENTVAVTIQHRW